MLDVKSVTEIRKLAALRLSPKVLVTTNGGATTVIKTVSKRRKVVNRVLPKGGWLLTLQTRLAPLIGLTALLRLLRPSPTLPSPAHHKPSLPNALFPVPSI